MMNHLRERGTKIVEVSTEGEPTVVYRNVLEALATSLEWTMLTADRVREESKKSPHGVQKRACAHQV